MFDMMNNAYYKSLPRDVGEQVRECGLIFHTEDDLRKFVAGLKRQ